MPGSMIHLIAAKKVRPSGSALFFLGNLAPDAVSDRYRKEIVHFREREDRLPALVALAGETEGDFAEGILLHLYLDWRWDDVVRAEFMKKSGGDWFPLYRRELSLAGGYAFHHIEWARGIWSDMEKADVGAYGITPYASAQEVREYVRRNNRWHQENATGCSPAFPPEMIEDFSAQVAQEYAQWRARRSPLDHDVGGANDESVCRRNSRR